MKCKTKVDNEVRKLLTACIKAKDQGHDLFFSYSPHVAMISVNISVGGFKDEFDYVFHEYLDKPNSEELVANLNKRVTHIIKAASSKGAL